ncbi:MAG: hypothetical protein GY730_03360 [bacterium]|nr:hypothetical protein [bacterium]
MNKIVSLKKNDFKFSLDCLKNEDKEDILVAGFINEDFSGSFLIFPDDLINMVTAYAGKVMHHLQQLNDLFKIWSSKFHSAQAAYPVNCIHSNFNFNNNNGELCIKFSLDYRSNIYSESNFDIAIYKDFHKTIYKKLKKFISKLDNCASDHVNNTVESDIADDENREISLQSKHTDSSIVLSVEIPLLFTGFLDWMPFREGMVIRPSAVDPVFEQTKKILRFFGSSTLLLNCIKQHFTEIPAELKNNIEKYYGFTVSDMFKVDIDAVHFTFKKSKKHTINSKKSNSYSHMNNIINTPEANLYPHIRSNRSIEIKFLFSLLKTFKIFTALAYDKPVLVDIDISRLGDEEYINSISNKVTDNENPLLKEYLSFQNRITNRAVMTEQPSQSEQPEQVESPEQVTSEKNRDNNKILK